MAISFVGSHVGTHAATSAQNVAFSLLRDGADAQPTLQAGDLVLVAVENASTVDRTQAQLTPSGYTALHTDDYRNDSNDSNFLVSYKFMGPTPDSSVDIPASNATTAGVAYAIYVFRGVDQTTPFDVSPVVTGGTNTGVANPAAVDLTSATAGALIIAFAGAAVAAGAVFTKPTGASSTTNYFRSATITTTTNDANIGGAIYATYGGGGGTYDPDPFGGSTSTNTGSWSAVTIALRPKSTSFTQLAYRLRNNNGSETGASWAAAANTPASLSTGLNYRVRFVISSDTTASQAFKLQYRLNGGSWTDATTSTQQLYVASAGSVSDGQATTQQVGSGSFVAGVVKEGSSTATPAINFSGSSETEIEYCIGFGNLVQADVVDLRLVKSDGGVLDTYTQTPTITALRYVYEQFDYRFRNDDGSQTTATWQAAANVTVPQQLNTNFRLRYTLKNSGGDVAPSFSVTENLQFNVNGGAWTSVAASGTAVVFALSSNFADGDATTQQISAGSFAAGIMKEDGSFDNINSLAIDTTTEFEYCLQLNGAVLAAGDVVRLRIYDVPNTQPIATYDEIILIVPIPVGLAAETDTALALAGGGITAEPVGLATETASAFALGKVLSKSTGLSTEVTTAFALTAFQARPLGFATSTNLALNLTARLLRATGLALETSLASALARRISVSIGLASETSLASARTNLQARSAGLSTEIDTTIARPAELLGAPVPIGLSTETNAAIALGKLLVKNLGLATETSSAQGHGIALKAGLTLDTSAAFARPVLISRSVGFATSAEQSFGLAAYITAAIGIAQESDTALSLSATLLTPVAFATSTETALALTFTTPTVLAQKAFAINVRQLVHQLNATTPAHALEAKLTPYPVQMKQLSAYPLSITLAA